MATLTRSGLEVQQAASLFDDCGPRDVQRATGSYEEPDGRQHVEVGHPVK